jgi:hypothetical protein
LIKSGASVWNRFLESCYAWFNSNFFAFDALDNSSLSFFPPNLARKKNEIKPWEKMIEISALIILPFFGAARKNVARKMFW